MAETRCSECKQIIAYEGKRILNPDSLPHIVVSNPTEAYEQLKRELCTSKVEKLIGLYMDAGNRLVHRATLSIGGLNSTQTSPEEVIRPAILNYALGIVIAHNHPSGSLEPSKEDLDFTIMIKQACDLFTVTLYDHLVISKAGFVSLKERRCL